MRFSAYAEENAAVMELTVRSCGHIFAREGRRISRPGGRSDWLLLYIARGSETFFLPQETVAAEGSFVIYRPGEPQEHICHYEKNAEFYYIHFTAPADFDCFGLCSSQVYTGTVSRGICDIFEAIMTELQMQLPFAGKIGTCRLMELMLLLKRNISDAKKRSFEHMDKVAYVMQKMNRDFEEQHTLDDYAQMCSMSKYHFLRVFENITGTSPMEYRSALRIEHAKELLEETSLSAGEIGERLGYTSASYFCDAFKRRVGCSPTEYREKI